MICFIGCGNPYQKEEKRYVVFEKGGKGAIDSIHFAFDTMIIYREYYFSNKDSSIKRLAPSGTYTDPILPQKHYDTNSVIINEQNGVLIITQNGDLLTDSTVKNVYEK